MSQNVDEQKGGDSNAQASNISDSQYQPVHYSSEQLLMAINNNISALVNWTAELAKQTKISNKLTLEVQQVGQEAFDKDMYEDLYEEIEPNDNQSQ